MSKTSVFMSDSHSLILKPNGDLYAFSNSSTNSMRGHHFRGVSYEQPVLVSKYVKDAAAGREATIFLSNSGHVNLLGDSIFCERFKGFSNAKRVFANCECEIYTILDSAGSWFAFGINDDICLEEHRTIHRFHSQRFQVKYWQESGTSIEYRTDGPNRIHEYSNEHNNGYEQVSKFLDSLTAGKIYRQFVEEYGENITFHEDIKKTQVPYNETGITKMEEWLVESHIELSNIHIYQPVKLEMNPYTKLPIYYGSELVHKDTDAEKVQLTGYEKVVFYSAGTGRRCRSKGMALYPNGELYELFMNDGEPPSSAVLSDKPCADNVADIAGAHDRFLFSKRDGTVWYYKSDFGGFEDGWLERFGKDKVNV